MVWHTVPHAVQLLFPKRIWRGDPSGNRVFLSFDDGPVPGATDYVLNELEKRGQKATFFMVGDNVRKHQSLAMEVVNAGHGIGNHTFNHLNGWKTPAGEYLQNVRAFDETVGQKIGIQTNLFRPPYGLITGLQAKSILKSKKVLMWDVLSGDYDLSLPPSRIMDKTTANTRAGSIVVFHDQQKTQDVLPKVLPAYLDFLVEMGFETALL